MDWFSIADVLEAGSSHSWPWFYWLWQETFAFLAILFTRDISVTRPLLPFRCKGLLLPTSTLLQVKSSFSCQATRQDSLRGKLHLGAQSLSSEFPELTSLRPPRCASAGVTSPEPVLSLVTCCFYSWRGNQCFSLYTHSLCARYIFWQSLLLLQVYCKHN